MLHKGSMLARLLFQVLMRDIVDRLYRTCALSKVVPMVPVAAPPLHVKDYDSAIRSYASTKVICDIYCVYSPK